MVISCIRLSSVASARATSPTARPSRMTRTRSAIARISGSSEEIAMIAMPLRASWSSSWWTSALAATSMPRVGSSTIRIFGLQRQPAGEHHLLLVAAGEVADQLIGAGHADVQGLLVLIDQRQLGALVDEGAQPQQPAEGGQRQVVAHRQGQEERLLLAVLGHQADAGPDRILGRADRDRLAPDPDLAADRRHRRRRCSGRARSGRSPSARRCPESRRRGPGARPRPGPWHGGRGWCRGGRRPGPRASPRPLRVVPAA